MIVWWITKMMFWVIITTFIIGSQVQGMSIPHRFSVPVSVVAQEEIKVGI